MTAYIHLKQRLECAVECTVKCTEEKKVIP